MAENKRVHQQTARTAKDKARHQAIRESLAGRPTPEELVAAGAYEQPVPHGLVLDAMRLLGQLRTVREAANLSLGEVAHASGLAKPALNRLETDHQDDPTLLTVLRYAHALGKRVVWTLEDEPVKGKPTQNTPDAREVADSPEALGASSKTGNNRKKPTRKRTAK